MPDMVLQKNGIQNNASTEYGYECLIDFPKEQLSSGAWNILLQQIPSPNLPHKHYFIALAVSREPREISDWPEKEDPFTREDLLDSQEDQVQELIFRIRTSLSVPYREHLANRLITLFNDAKEEDPYSLGISYGSLQNFYNFLQLHDNLKRPAIALTPEYNIYASWRDNKKRVFSVHFLPSGDVRFVIFKPNDRHPERMIRLSGTATTDILLETVAASEILNWISE
jgi:hypothetical protein